MIKNVVFDIGNVLVKWDPLPALVAIFPEQDPQKLYYKMSPTWIKLNLGKLHEEEAIQIYILKLNSTKEKIKQLFFLLKKSQTMILGMPELLQKLSNKNIELYALTDNIKEWLAYHKMHSNFLHYFKGIVSSSDIGSLKPDPKNYLFLLNTYNLLPKESVFIDDLKENVNGAIHCGMHAFQFKDAASCEQELIALGVNI